MAASKRLYRLAQYCFTGIVILSVSTLAGGVIRISSIEDLQKIGKDSGFPLNGHYLLTNDVDVSSARNLEADSKTFDGRGWRPIGASAAGFYRCRIPGNLTEECAVIPDADSMFNGGAFSGTFDGNGYTIRGLYVDRVIPITEIEGIDYQPLHHLSAGLFGVLRGAAVINLTIEADTVAVHGQFAAHSSAAGILAGFSYNSTITNVHTKGTVAAIGRPSVSSSTMTHLLGAGGLLGIDAWSNITNSSSEVTLSSMPAARPKSDLGWWGDIPNNKAGGLVGTIEFTTVNGCRATTEIYGTGSHAGGLVGENNGGTISKSAAAVTGQSLNITTVGGLVGANNRRSGPLCPDCYDGDGANYPATIDQSYSSVNLNRSGGAHEMGGLVGHDAHSIIQNSYSTGTLTCGIAAADIAMGGLVGYSRRFWISNWTEPEVSRNNYAAVSISGQAGVQGGLVGVRTPYYDIEEELQNFPFMLSYWDAGLTQAGGISLRPFGESGRPTVVPGVTAGGNGKTTIEMKQQSTFAGWDFTDIWRIDEGSGYPYLAWQNESPAMQMVSISGKRAVSGINRNHSVPTVTVRGKVLNVKTSSSTTNLQIRLVDMKGRTAANFKASGGSGNFRLNRVAAGRYLVDIKNMESGKRFTSSIVLR